MTASSFDGWYAFVERPENDGNANDTAISNAGTGDGAGETRYGWTLPTWRAEAHHLGRADLSLVAFRAETPATLKPLARDAFWSRLSLDAVPTGADVMVADFVFGSGGAIRAMQRGLGIGVDGVLGPATRAAITAMGGMPFVLNCYRWRVGYYDACGFQDLWPGLYRRAQDCRQLALELMNAPAAAAAPATR